MDLEKLQELVRILESSSLAEVEIEEEGTRIKLKKPEPQVVAAPQIPLVTTQHVQHAAPAPVASAVPAPAVVEQSAPQEKEAHITIDAPMVGVFYISPAPGEPPFTSPGDTIEKDQTVCIVEAMKLMNEVVAQFPARILKVLVENGEPVEFGQPLFAVEPL